MVYRLNVKEKQKNDHNRTFLFSYLLAHSLDRSIGFVDDFFFSMHSKKCFLWRSKQKNRSHTKMLPAIDLLGIRRCDQRFNFQVYSWKSDEIGFFIIYWLSQFDIMNLYDFRRKKKNSENFCCVCSASLLLATQYFSKDCIRFTPIL